MHLFCFYLWEMALLPGFIRGSNNTTSNKAKAAMVSPVLRPELTKAFIFVIFNFIIYFLVRFKLRARPDGTDLKQTKTFLLSGVSDPGARMGESDCLLK